jgi:acyl-[acyl-carrier-protein] desaturase
MRISEQERPELSHQRVKDINNRITVLEIDRPGISPERRKILAENTELIKGLDSFVGKLVDEREAAYPINSLWMPHQFLPDLGTEKGRMEDLPRLQAEMNEYSDAEIAGQVLVSLTEDGLPLFMSALAAEPSIGVDLKTGWGRWSHRWTGEENRHGVVIVDQITESGRVDMVAYERMKTAYLRNGFDTYSDGDAVEFVVYTELQEDGTQISHRRESRIAKKNGAGQFAKAVAEVSGEEGDHKTIYRKVTVKAAEENPDAVLIGLRDMVKKGVNMPGARITDGKVHDSRQVESGLFADLKLVAEKTGIYTMRDYLGVVKGLANALNVGSRTDLRTSEGRKAQDQLGRFDQKRQDSVGGRFAEDAKKKEMPTFPWVRPQEVKQKYVVFESPK